MTQLVVRPDAGCTGEAPVLSRMHRPATRVPRTTALIVAVLGDCELVTRGLAQMLTPYAGRVRLRPPAEPSGAASAPEWVNGCPPPDVILFDCYAGGLRDGVVRALPAPPASGGSRVVAYSWETREDLVSAALQHGYRGYIAKSLSGRRVVEALEQVGRGERVVAVPSRPVDQAAVPVRWSREEARLTLREVDVLDLIAAGRTNAEIALQLHVSINSIKSYVRTSYRKIGATTRSQAVLWGIAQGLGASEV